MREALRRVVDRLVADSAGSGRLTLDAVGEALAEHAVTPAEIGEVLDALERRLRTVSAETTSPAIDLQRVLAASRALRARGIDGPSMGQVATEAGIDEGAVRAALLFARVLGRS